MKYNNSVIISGHWFLICSISQKSGMDQNKGLFLCTKIKRNIYVVFNLLHDKGVAQNYLNACTCCTLCRFWKLTEKYKQPDRKRKLPPRKKGIPLGKPSRKGRPSNGRLKGN